MKKLKTHEEMQQSIELMGGTMDNLIDRIEALENKVHELEFQSGRDQKDIAELERKLGNVEDDVRRVSK